VTTDGRINLAEGLEQMLDLLLGNADARVLDRKTDFAPLSFSAVTETVTSPAWVNLTALPSRFTKILVGQHPHNQSLGLDRSSRLAFLFSLHWQPAG